MQAIIDANANPIAELMSFSPPSLSTARLLSEHGLGAAAQERLRSTNFLIIAGGSGAGKSTLAMGVPGSVAAEGARVYRYVRSANQDNRAAQRGVSLTVIPSLRLW
jgi:ABC-type hemin transport system ATPase subunit